MIDDDIVERLILLAPLRSHAELCLIASFYLCHQWHRPQYQAQGHLVIIGKYDLTQGIDTNTNAEAAGPAASLR